ncbi:MAG: penicillin-binding protein activator LpoB [Treponema sp.]|jgi:TolB-like protein|nr:penicillin-binding protein activator LpoB [Treponema sp.]
MKRVIFPVLGLLVAGILTAQEAVPLGDAIIEAAGEIQGKVRRNSKLAILDISSRSGRLSDYILEELMAEIVNGSYVTVVEREELDLIAEELEYQSSSGVSDRSAARAGKKLGAQYIVTGTFDQADDNYRLRIKVIEVETAAIRLMFNETVLNDTTVANLMGRRGGASAAASGNQREILEAAEREILAYFKRYGPVVERQGNKVHGDAVYGKYIVKVDVTLAGTGYNIDIQSGAKAKLVAKWKIDLRKRIDKRLGV